MRRIHVTSARGILKQLEAGEDDINTRTCGGSSLPGAAWWQRGIAATTDYFYDLKKTHRKHVNILGCTDMLHSMELVVFLILKQLYCPRM